MVAVISGVALFMLAQVALNHFNEEVTEEFAIVSTHHDLNFEVHYMRNSMFEENPIPQNFNFLMSFTDYILVNDSFRVSVSQPTNIYYDFAATKRLVVVSSDAGDNVIVFEQSTILDEGSGQSHGTRVQISGMGTLYEDASFALSPRDYIFWYRQFAEYHQQQMIREDIMGLGGGRSLSAELRIDFSYNIHMPEINHRESSSRGFVIPLDSEVYNLVASGTPSNENRVLLSRTEATPAANAPPVFVFVAGVLICLAALVWSVVMFIKDDDEGESQIMQILKKYSDNLVMTDSAIDFSNSNTVEVKDFKEMLKLSAWLTKPIIYCAESLDVDFMLAAEDFTYVYSVASKGEKTPAKKMAERELIFETEPEESNELEEQSLPIEFEEHLKKKREGELYIPRRARQEADEEDTEYQSDILITRKSRFGYSKLI